MLTSICVIMKEMLWIILSLQRMDFLFLHNSTCFGSVDSTYKDKTIVYEVANDGFPSMNKLHSRTRRTKRIFYKALLLEVKLSKELLLGEIFNVEKEFRYAVDDNSCSNDYSDDKPLENNSCRCYKKILKQK